MPDDKLSTTETESKRWAVAMDGYGHFTLGKVTKLTAKKVYLSTRSDDRSFYTEQVVAFLDSEEDAKHLRDRAVSSRSLMERECIESRRRHQDRLEKIKAEFSK